MSFSKALGREDRLLWTVKGPQLQQGNVLGNLGGEASRGFERTGERTAFCYEQQSYTHFPVSQHFKAESPGGQPYPLLLWPDPSLVLLILNSKTDKEACW